TITGDSLWFQQWLDFHIREKEGISTIKLHGGSDGTIPEHSDYGVRHANKLSTHSGNWQAVVTELIQAASVIVFLVSDLTPGVAKEFDLVRELGQTNRCLVVVHAGHTFEHPSPTFDRSGDLAIIRGRLAGFPNVFDVRLNGRNTSYPEQLTQVLTRLIRGARTQAPLEQTLQAKFSYLEPGFVDSEDFVTTEQLIWRGLHRLRVLFDDTYWAALKANGVAFEHLEFSGAWVYAHHL